jgi:hypothetical protein
MRAEPSHRSEMVNQLLFGEHYMVLEEHGDWLRIKNAFDDYEGFISRIQHTEASSDYYKQIETHDYKISLELMSPILFRKERMYIALGSILPFSANELFKMEESMAFAGEAKPLSQMLKMPAMKEMAMKYLHAPYLWGGRSPLGIDCSGLTQQVYKLCGYRLQRDASQQFRQGKDIAYSHLLPGDLAFFEKEGKVDHVGIVMDEQKILHASGKVKVDQLSEEGIRDVNQILTHRLIGIKRIIM